MKIDEDISEDESVVDMHLAEASADGVPEGLAQKLQLINKLLKQMNPFILFQIKTLRIRLSNIKSLIKYLKV